MPEYLRERLGGQRIRVYFGVVSLIHYMLVRMAVSFILNLSYIMQHTDYNHLYCNYIDLYY